VTNAPHPGATPSDIAPDTLSNRTQPDGLQSLPRGWTRPVARQWQEGIAWALLSPIFLGTIPILAKLAFAAGVDVLTLVAFRALIAAMMLWLAALIFTRHFIYSSTPAVASSLLAGTINGIGSIFFYAGLMRIDASLGQLINVSYLVYVTLFLRLAGHTVSWLTMGRVGLTLTAIYLLTAHGLGPPDRLGVGLMLLAALLYAVQLVISQRILYDIPAPTMTLYAITAMALVVGLAWLLFRPEVVVISTAGWRFVFLMALLTALARLTLFLGVKHLGSIQTALIGVLEVVVTIVIAIVWLHESFAPLQWLGAAVLLVSVLLVKYERDVPRFYDWWRIFWQVKWKDEGKR
jgi:drug/metabolite transporter (DMT)-like permease